MNTKKVDLTCDPLLVQDDFWIPVRPHPRGKMFMKKRVPDKDLTELRVGDLFLPNEQLYIQNPAVFLGFSWEEYEKRNEEKGWLVYPWVYVSGAPHGMSFEYIESIKLLQKYPEPSPTLKPMPLWRRFKSWMADLSD